MMTESLISPLQCSLNYPPYFSTYYESVPSALILIQAFFVSEICKVPKMLIASYRFVVARFCVLKVETVFLCRQLLTLPFCTVA
jgi:hypothetical protein